MKVQEPRVIANGDDNMESITEDGSQAADNGSTCCRDLNPSENAVSFNLEPKINGQKKKGIKNQICINIGNKGVHMPTWLETWESEDAYAALALIGAAVSVAVAYNCYRQLG
ncbi:hypothetical protein SSX86_006852 [Deinandra increscens subsp. villosa]|uniref:Uncharacterized protein n=1 Tax=Deinandra increscens subsp. villosa TaxID=3103831 RepID=A0AAP0DJJ8_9ASTR